MKQILLAALLLAALVLGCVSIQQPPQAALSSSATATPYASASASPSIVPSPAAALAADRALAADPIYLGLLKPLAKAGAEVRIKVSVKNNALQFEDFFNADTTASSREIMNFSQPVTVWFNILANNTDLYFGSLMVESDLPPRSNSTSFAFVDILATDGAFTKKDQKREVTAHVTFNKSVEFSYDKIPNGEGFVVYFVLFPTTPSEPSRADFDRFYAANKGWHSIRFLHKTPLGTAVVAEIKLLFE